MNKILLYAMLGILFVGYPVFGQMTGEELLDKAISYHDPTNAWPSFNGEFTVTMDSPNRPSRKSIIKVNAPKSYFFVEATRSDQNSVFEVNGDECKIRFNGSDQLNEADVKKHGLSCERAKMYRNYYSYLYGLPMKLKDRGTIIDPLVERKTFKGKEYLVLKATYEKSVGSDIWYFYFDPKTYAMEVYQFYKTDKDGNLKPKSGEYILLSEEEKVNGVKMPKIRAWYYNKDDKYLGTDTLNK